MSRIYSSKVFAIPYVAVFAVIGVVGWQLLRPSSAAPVVAGDVSIRLSQVSYRVDDTVRFTLINKSDTTVTVPNNCPDAPLLVYRRESGAWRQLHAKADAARCPNTLRSYDVAAHGSVSASYGAWPDLFAQPGHYRLVAPLEQQQVQPSVEFDVTP